MLEVITVWGEAQFASGHLAGLVFAREVIKVLVVDSGLRPPLCLRKSRHAVLPCVFVEVITLTRKSLLACNDFNDFAAH